MKAKKPVLGAHFPPYQWFYRINYFKKKKKKSLPVCGLTPPMLISRKLVQNCDLYCDSNYKAKI